MANPLVDAVKNAASNAVSTVLCSASGVQRGLNDLNGKINPFYSGSSGEAVTRALERGLGAFCDTPPPPRTPKPAPFKGGQCPISYAVTIRRCANLGSPGAFCVQTDIRTVIGPVRGVVRRGSTAFLLSGSPDLDVGSWSDSNSYSVASVIPSAGGADTCGDAPPTPAPPAPPPANPRPPGTTVNVNVSGRITPVVIVPVVGVGFVNVNGKLTIPVSLNANYTTNTGDNISLNFDVDVDVSGDGSPPVVRPDPPDQTPDGRPTRPDCPPPADCLPGRDGEDETPDEPPLDPDSPDDKPGEEIKAVRVKSVVSTTLVRATEIDFVNPGPNIYAPRIGSLKFLYAASGGGTTYSTDIDVKATDQVVAAPKMGLRCLGALFSPQGGVVGQTFYVRGPIQQGW